MENGWDFNDPSAIAGFGPISAEEIARLAGGLIGALPAAELADQVKEALASDESQLASSNVLSEGPPEGAAKTAEAGGAGDDAAQQNETDNKS